MASVAGRGARCRAALATATLAAMLLLAGATPAQRVIDHDFPAPLQISAGGDLFSDGSTLAFADAGVITVVAGLPAAAAVTTTSPAGPLAMPSSWRRLSPTVAVYRAVGGDLMAGTPDDPLVLVTGLPGNPTLVPTAITGVDAAFAPVNETTAVRASSQLDAFEVLRHGPAGATLATIPSTTALHGSAHFAQGAVSGDAYAVWGTGTDLAPGTPDDILVLLTGLHGALTEFQVSAIPAPAPSIEGFVVTPSGAVVCWEIPSTHALTLHIGSDLSTAPNFDSITVPFPPGVFPGWALDHGVRAAPGDSVLVWWNDDAGPGRYSCFVLGLSTLPVVTPLWSDNFEFSILSTVVGEGEIVTDHMHDLNGPAVFTRWALPGAGSQTLGSGAGRALAYHRLSPGGLVRMGEMPGVDTRAAVTTGLPGPGTTTLFTAPGVATVRSDLIGPGLVAWFRGPSASSNPTELAVITVPTFDTVGTGLPGGPSPLELTLLPAAPMAGPLEARTWIDPLAYGGSPAATFLLFSSGIAAPTSLPGTPFRTHLDPAGLSPDILELVQTGPEGVLVVDASPLLPFAGIPVYVQAAGVVVTPAGIVVVLGDTCRIILG